MKRSIALSLSLVLFFAFGVTAEAKKKPTSVKLYFHGTETIGEIDTFGSVGTLRRMDTTEPSDPAPKSVAWYAWAGPPWNDCAAMFTLPVWTGSVSGRIVGDIKVTLHTVSGPTTLEVQVWPDVTTQTCASNDVSEGQYPEPAAQTTVDIVGNAASEIVLKDVNIKAVGALTIQFRPTSPVPGRVLFDGADYSSSIEFRCIPKSGKSCV